METTVMLLINKFRFMPPFFFLFLLFSCSQAMCVKVPDDPEHLAARRKWRDECLMRLATLKSQMQSQ